MRTGCIRPGIGETGGERMEFSSIPVFASTDVIRPGEGRQLAE